MSAEIEKIKTELILKPLNSKEELRDWMYTFFGLKFPMGVVYPTSTHGPIDAAWRIYELMKTGQSQDVPEVVLLSSRDSYKCQIKGSKLLTPNGLRNIEDIKVGDIVWSGTAWRRVTAWIDDGFKDGIKITLSNNIELTSTPIHRYWILREGQEQWCRVQDLKPSDLVCFNIDTGLSNLSLNEDQESFDDGYFLGLLAGDGGVSSIESPTHSHISFTTIDEKLKKWYFDFCQKRFKITPNQSKHDPITYCIWNNGVISKIKEKYGILKARSWEKVIPEYCYKNNSAMIGFISGLFDTDGTFDSKNSIDIPITAGQLLKELQIVLASWGVNSKYRPNSKKYGKQNHTIHHLIISAPEAYKLYNRGFKNQAAKAGGEIRQPQIYNAHDTLPYEHVQFFLDFCANNVPQIRNRKHIKPKISYRRNKADGIGYKGITYGKLNELTLWLKENVAHNQAGEGGVEVLAKIDSILKNKWYPVTKTEKIDSAHFFDLTVEHDHSYWSNGSISHNTLIASAIEVLCLIHFEISIAHAAAILSQSEKAVSYANSFFNKISPYLKNNGWEKTSDNKTKIEWRTSKGDTIYLRVLVMTRKGMNCVLGSTKIRTDQGALSASDIYKQICEGVKFRFLSFNHGTSQLEYKNVVCTEKTKQTDTYTVETSKGTVQVSGDHKIYVEGVGYVKAKDVKEGDVILRAKGDRSYLHSNHGKRNDIKNIKEQLKSFTNIKLLSDKYKNNTTPMSFSCSDHGVFERKWCKIQDRIQKSLNPCPSCNRKQGVENQRLTKQQITDQIQETDFKLIDIKYYQTSRDSKLELECSKGHVFEINHNNFLTNVRCTKCSSVSSKSQNEIYEYVKSIYNKQVVLNDRKAIAPLELDIYIPEKNFGIEFDGLYWHSEKVKSDIKQNNISKIQKITEKNTSLLAIYEDEWANPVKQELIKAMIRNRLGIKPLYTKRASKLFVKKLTKNKDFKHFFDTYHLDGHVNASFAYGLFDGEKMVSCMSFRKSFSDKEWEIARFATDYNYKVHGNAGKLVAEFKKEYNTKLVTYSNNRLSHGDVYEKLGFKDITKTMSPSYYYTDFVTRLWRFKCKKINDPEILREFPTEKLQAEGGVFSKKYLGHNKPLYRIYDYGHKKWIKE